ncbi:MAG TPA: DUF4476 domain-containing protein [Ferruginibacter sp.]|nr:DUF4476 domain-containing protein [Ferruginibacter sp.]
MKKIYTLVALVFLSLASFAFNSRLSISTVDNSNRILVVIDGKVYKTGNGQNNDIVIDDLRAGYHSVKLYKTKGNYFGWGNNRHRGREILMYNGNVYVRNGYHTDILINRFGKAFTDERQIGRYDNDDDNDNGYNDRDDFPWNRDRKAMNERRFEQMKQSIANESFEDNKMSILKTAIRDNWISTNQATALVKLFSFENNKLHIAKHCYKYTTDYQNYYLVANAFNYSSSKQELLQYIEANKRNH